jgi:hypothetical protein
MKGFKPVCGVIITKLIGPQTLKKVPGFVESSLMMEAARTSETFVDNYFTRQYISKVNSELHTCRRENLKSQILRFITLFTKTHPPKPDESIQIHTRFLLDTFYITSCGVSISIEENELGIIGVSCRYCRTFKIKHHISISLCLISVKVNYLYNCNYISTVCCNTWKCIGTK